jgi:predicted extracellular nuclease
MRVYRAHNAQGGPIMPTQYYVAWWNVENLFDSVNSPRRTEKLKRALGKSLQGWTTTLRDKKISQLLDVIESLNDGAGPDLLGVCEVENEFVMQKLVDGLNARLPGRQYALVHADTIDKRGIDIAFIYETAKLEVPPGAVFQHSVLRRTATRDILQVNFVAKPGGRMWAIFGNHWPSRSGGQAESDGYRQIAGETLAYFHQRAREVHGDDLPVLAMGDFNDEPFNASVRKYALAVRKKQQVLRGRIPRLWNLMWPLMGRADGTFYFKNQANLIDQFLANENIIKPGGDIELDASSVTIESSFPGLSDPNDVYPQPIRFGGMGKQVDLNGYSDHYPISVVVNET